MAATLHSFTEVFSATFDSIEGPVQVTKIEIPKIQRDYVQGRDSKEAINVRKRFLKALSDAVKVKPITLDFIYGSIDRDGVMIPLDGQQRLTTLFLLYWYAAKKEGIPLADSAYLQKFSYETRYSARDFCKALSEFNPDFTVAKSISAQIINQSWFPLEWKKDPSISSMLNMLDAISEEFKDVENLWQKLLDGAISFYFLPINDLGLTDELYIKMNSRGKPLTQFEHFKAEFERNIKQIDVELAKSIILKIDTKWTDLLWEYRGGNNIIDDEFLNYFKYICSLIYYKNGESTQDKSFDEFDLLENLFSLSNEHAKENVFFVEKMFDCWLNLPNGRSPGEYQGLFISSVHEPGKIVSTKTDVFRECLENPDFTLGNKTLLYAIVVYLMNRDVVTEDLFRRRLRIVQNLIRNSKDEISDSTIGQGRNRMPTILKQVDSIILNGMIDEQISLSFNVIQLREEKEKIDWVEQNKDRAEILFKLEDHKLLYGQIGILGLDNIDIAERFSKLFENEYDLVGCALMAEGNFAQYKGRQVYQLGSKRDSAWESLFHQTSDNPDFSATHTVMVNLLRGIDLPSKQTLSEKVNQYIDKCEKDNIYDFRYYYIKYPCFRSALHGKYFCSNIKQNPYGILVMMTPTKPSENSYQPFLKVLGKGVMDRENLGRNLILGEYVIRCDKTGYRASRIVSGATQTELIDVSQNAEGIDTENRIEKMRQWIESKGL